MGATLAQLEARVAGLLYDATNAVFSTATIDEGLRQALERYNDAVPLTSETVITLPGVGREIALNGIADLLQVMEVWWPFDSDGSEAWPPNRVQGFRLWWDDAQPVLFLNAVDGAQPQRNDEVRIWYTKPHTIQNLDGASVTTLPTPHETLLVRGAAGYACLARSVDLNETSANMAVSTPNYAALAEIYLNDISSGFLTILEQLKAQSNVRGEPFGEGWRMDKWEGK
ncbi:MAG TPA: hypothetical protein VFD70_29550 [Anaerolineae bacterium]|nr:hypothetical protein [Anaerolineae bacterium]